MKYLKNKKNGSIFAIRGYGVLFNESYYTLRQKGTKRDIQIREKLINKDLVKYKPGFFEKIKLFFHFL